MGRSTTSWFKYNVEGAHYFINILYSYVLNFCTSPDLYKVNRLGWIKYDSENIANKYGYTKLAFKSSSMIFILKWNLKSTNQNLVYNGMHTFY